MLSLFSKNVKFKDLHFTADVHSHLLPGVDDGFKDEQHTREALGLLGDFGVRHFLLTPHIYPELYPRNSPEYIRERFSAIFGEMSGMDFRIAGEHMIYAGVESIFTREDEALLTFPDKERILIEMSYAFPAKNIRDVIFQLNTLGLAPVLAHPERYSYYSLSQISSLVDLDCELQVNALSLGGFYGKTAMAKAEAILEKGLYSYIGTDLHSVSQISQLEQLVISKKHVPAVERLIRNNEDIFAA